MTILIGNKYNIIDKLGEGAFGKIFIGENIITKERVAIKIENLDEKIMLKNDLKLEKSND